MSRALDLFREFEEKKEAFIKELLENKISEELFLDYKNVSTSNGAGKLSDDDKKNFAKAVSGFGNSDGGIIIWGIDCRRDEDGSDTPQGYQSEHPRLSAFSPEWFKSLLEGMTSGVTVPPHAGVRHDFCLRENKTEEGVVVTYIPAGMSVPFRAIVDQKEIFYIRSGSSFTPAPHAVVAALYGQRPQPVIEIVDYRFEKSNGSSIQLTLFLKNVGRGMAEDVFLLCDIENSPFECDWSSLQHDLWQISLDELHDTHWPVMAVTKPQARRLPPGGRLVLRFIVSFRPPYILSHLSDYFLQITAGSPGGPGCSMRYCLSKARMDEINAVYESGERPSFTKRNAVLRLLNAEAGHDEADAPTA
ncbi:AlbA family DNA-binding domain-containing protein [Acetobacter sp.]|jgi:hypothetical protein|uniref:AlbA family DNA-binding domain-containing protein n=1 Tax=Acetobacter sp. TaxID=440 RepID=UPI0025BBF85A|nr:ATP-binding protein [Acetobacter sp.]MCH4090593.1 ATP-binding protein [Acetobacter sp.]MCI1300036.1 ATP-binding protein [Acetobacter sp.]MCI1316454.1 ATP-binding protein [Acetobacter sp.]